MARKKRYILGRLYGQGYREYTATIGGFGTSQNDNWKHHHINILLIDIYGENVFVDHCWSRCRSKWDGVWRGDLIKFEARVARYSGGFKLANFRKIEILEKGCDRRRIDAIREV